MSDNIIQINNMNKWFGDFQVLKDINLEVKPKEKIVVCGPSGSGKSTLIRCINRLEEHQKGDIIVDGTQLTADTFGETKEGVWVPKAVTGVTYGTNGFYLKFNQTGTGTASASTIGADSSGNTNHLTSSGFASTDSNLPDSPTNNFCIIQFVICITQFVLLV